MTEFLKESELPERRAFIEAFIREIVVMPGKAVICYTIPISQSTPKLLYSWAVGLKAVESDDS